MFRDKSFTYYNSAEAKSLPKQANQVKEPKGRIRVNAGDRCVAPVKSRPKKRKSLTSTGPSYTMSMEHIEWSDETYAVPDIAQNPDVRFPLIVKVIQGYYGTDNVEFSADQVIQIHSVGFQKRVLCTDPSGRRLSVPLDYPIRIEIPDKFKGDLLTLTEALKVARVPFTAVVEEWTGEMSPSDPSLLKREIQVRKLYDDVFLRGNSINDGWIDQTNIILMPSFLGIELSVALSMHGATEDEWKEYQSMFSRTVRHLYFDAVKGYRDIAVFDNLAHSQSRQSLLYEKLGQPGRATGFIRMYSNETDDQQAVLEDKTYENLPPGRSLARESVNLNKNASRSEYTSLLALNVQATDFHARNSSGRKSMPDITHEPILERDHDDRSQNVTQMFEHVLRVAEESHAQENLPPHFRHSVRSSLKEQEDIFNGPLTPKEKPKGLIKPESVKNSNGLPDQKQMDSNNSPSLAPKAVVPPIVKSGDYVISVSVHANGEAKACRPDRKLETVDDIPLDVTELTVNELGHCLRLLNMENHISDFKKHQIDGSLLGDLTDKVLQEEFKMTPFNASKLMRFIRGWRPKMS